MIFLKKYDLANIRTNVRDELLVELNVWREEVGAEMMKINQRKTRLGFKVKVAKISSNE